MAQHKCLIIFGQMHAESMDLMIVNYLDGVATEEQLKIVDDWYQSFETKPPAYISGPAIDRKIAGEYLHLKELLDIV